MRNLSRKALITTIIPTYRRPTLLARAIRSVLAQTYPHFLVRIFDDASGDETAAIVQEFTQRDTRVQYHPRPVNVGLCRNFADAAVQVDTPFFSFLSNDDVLLPDFYKLALSNFDRFPEIMMSATAAINIDDQGQVLKIPIFNWRPGLYLPPNGMLSMIKNGHPDWAGVLFRKEVLEKIGPPDPDLGPPFDVDFQLRTAARFPMAVTLQPGALFVVHKDSAGLLGGFDGLCPGWYNMTQKILADETISLKVRAHAAHRLDKAIRSVLVRSSLSRIAKGNWTEANQAIRYLSNYSHLSRSILTLLLEACRRSEALRCAICRVIGLRRALFGLSRVNRPNEGLQSRFGSYGRRLQL